jgi:hypothetical protein
MARYYRRHSSSSTFCSELQETRASAAGITTLPVMLGIKRATQHTDAPNQTSRSTTSSDVHETYVEALTRFAQVKAPPHTPAAAFAVGPAVDTVVTCVAAHRPPASPTRLASIVVCLFASPSLSGEIYVEPAKAWSIAVQGSGSVVFRCNRRIPQHLEPSLRTRDTLSLCPSVGVLLVVHSHTSHIKIIVLGDHHPIARA